MNTETIKLAQRIAVRDVQLSMIGKVVPEIIKEIIDETEIRLQLRDI